MWPSRARRVIVWTSYNQQNQQNQRCSSDSELSRDPWYDAARSAGSSLSYLQCVFFFFSHLGRSICFDATVTIRRYRSITNRLFIFSSKGHLLCIVKGFTWRGSSLHFRFHGVLRSVLLIGGAIVLYTVIYASQLIQSWSNGTGNNAGTRLWPAFGFLFSLFCLSPFSFLLFTFSWGLSFLGLGHSPRLILPHSYPREGSYPNSPLLHSPLGYPVSILI